MFVIDPRHARPKDDRSNFIMLLNKGLQALLDAHLRVHFDAGSSSRNVLIQDIPKFIPSPNILYISCRTQPFS